MRYHGDTVKFLLMDTSNAETFGRLLWSYVRRCDCVFVVCDATDDASVGRAQWWVSEAKEHLEGTDCSLMLAGNKLDSDNPFRSEILGNLARDNGVKYFPCSAKRNIGLDAMLDAALNHTMGDETRKNNAVWRKNHSVLRVGVAKAIDYRTCNPCEC